LSAFAAVQVALSDDVLKVRGQKYADENGHLDYVAVVAAMVSACADLRSTLDEDAEISADLPCIQVALIAKALVHFVSDQPEAIRPVLDVAEEVLALWDQEGRDFIGACMLEGVPQGGEALLLPFAGRLVAKQMAGYL
jgi:hypothetical protein